jgi:hypothetical protein
MSYYRNDSEENIKAFFGLLILIFCALWFLWFSLSLSNSFISTDSISNSAKVNASNFADNMGWSATAIQCSGRDSDHDGYTSCTIGLEGGATKSINCGYKLNFALLGQNEECKMQNGVTLQ